MKNVGICKEDTEDINYMARVANPIWLGEKVKEKNDMNHDLINYIEI